MKEREALKPCPFCGESNFTEQRDEANFPQYRCENCGARGPCIDLGAADVATRWNTRAALASSPEPEQQGSSGPLPQSGVEAGMQDAASASGSLPFGIIDPDYARVFTMARCLAWSEGYALAMHGSFTRDLDLIAVPWTDAACEPLHLVKRIADATGLWLAREAPGAKPHGRQAWTLLFPGFADPRFVDVSVMPRLPKEPA